jgi:eukaryotic-like serine/threonine-protein kinase
MVGVIVDPRQLEVDRYLAAYEAAAQRDDQADLAAYLPGRDQPLYGTVLRELVRIDLELGWQRGRPRGLEDYERRFPELTRDPENLQAVAFEEYRLRHRAGENPLPDEYRQRYGVDIGDWPCPSATNGTAQTPEEGPCHASASPAEFPQAGASFLGFQLCAELGRGAFARVFLARQTELGDRFVALKIAADITGETRSLVQLQHTHIVPVYSIHRAGPLHAICMPYFGGITLADVLQKLRGRVSLPDSGKDLVQTLAAHKSTTREASERGSESGVSSQRSDKTLGESLTLDSCRATPAAILETLGKLTYVEAVLWLTARLADGLAHAHERGILHRDLKPANILLTEEGQPMLLDFNLSEDTKRRGASAAVVGGTLPYMAPEQLEAFRGGGRPVDARSDLYALGVILFESLTGRLPFPVHRGSVHEMLATMHADRFGSIPQARCWNPAVSPAVDSIIRRCLEPEPARRYQSAAQLREDLQRHLESQPLRHAPESSRAERLRKWRRRHPGLFSTTAVTIGAAVAVAVLLTLLVLRGWRLGRLEARDARRQLGEDLKAIQFHLSRPGAERRQREEGMELCRLAAQRYGLPDARFAESALVRSLPTEEQGQLRSELGDLLLAWARGLSSQASTESDPERQRDLVRLALRVSDGADECYGPEAAPRALWLERARLAELAGDTAQAERWRARAADVQVLTPRDHYLLLLHEAGRGAPRQALAYLHEASKHAAESHSFWLVLGNCHAALGQRAEAAGYYDIGIALWPDEPWAYFNRGLIHLDGDNHARAAADFDQVIRLRPNMREAYFNRALARLGLDRPADALEDLTHVLENLPQPPTRVYFARARLRGRLGDLRGQREDFEEGLRRAPTDEHDCVTRGVARVANDPEGALADFERALRFNPHSRRALQNQASVLAERLGQPAKAIEKLDRLLELHPESALALAGRGVLHARLQECQAAHRDAQAALARDRTAPLMYQVAGIYALTSRQHPDDRQEAMRLLSAALNKGYGSDLLDKDADLDPLRGHEEFARLVQAAKELRKGTK